MMRGSYQIGTPEELDGSTDVADNLPLPEQPRRVLVQFVWA
jgi:hypothetical protein